MAKDFLDFLFKVGIAPIVYSIGILSIALFMLSYTKEYAWITKAMVLYLFTH